MPSSAQIRISSDLAVTALGVQDGALFVRRIHILILDCAADAERSLKVTDVPVASPPELHRERLMSKVQGAELAPPPTRLGMSCIASLALREDIPEAMQLTMLAEQMRPAELRRVNPRCH